MPRILLLLLLLCLQQNEVHSKAKYLYKQMGEEAFPVKEYVVVDEEKSDVNGTNHTQMPTTTNSSMTNSSTTNSSTTTQTQPEKWEVHVIEEKEGKLEIPSFLWDPDGGHRVVEFYAPWCPHCKHFKPKYIEFARKMTKTMFEEYDSEIQFFAVSCTAHHPLCVHFGIKSFPTIVVLQDGRPIEERVSLKAFELHPFQLLNDLGIHADNLGIGEGEDQASLSLSSNSDGKKRNPNRIHVKIPPSKRNKQEIYSDAYASFQLAMRQSIFMSKDPLTNSTKDAFESWLELLDDALPPRWQIHASLKALRGKIDEASESEEKLIAILDASHPDDANKDPEWSDNCSFTCGLWELFHVMSVGTVEWNRAVTNKYAVFPVNEAADALHDYVLNFFACDVCRTNFVHSYDACEHDRCTRLTDTLRNEFTWKEFPVWLWETHNSVNVRLMKEQAEREGVLATPDDEIDVQWPSRDACPQCWGIDGSYNEEWVYNYLRLEYWPDDDQNREFRIKLASSRRDALMAHRDEEDHGYENERDDDYESGMSQSIPVIIALVPIVAVLVVGLYLYGKKRRLQKTGRHKKFDLS